MGQTREQRIIKQLSGNPTTQQFTPIATSMFLPNHSGISTHPEFKKALDNLSDNYEVLYSNANLFQWGDGATTIDYVGTDINVVLPSDLGDEDIILIDMKPLFDATTSNHDIDLLLINLDGNTLTSWTPYVEYPYINHELFSNSSGNVYLNYLYADTGSGDTYGGRLGNALSTLSNYAGKNLTITGEGNFIAVVPTINYCPYLITVIRIKEYTP